MLIWSRSTNEKYLKMEKIAKYMYIHTMLYYVCIYVYFISPSYLDTEQRDHGNDILLVGLSGNYKV